MSIDHPEVSSHRLVGGNRATQASDRHQRHRSRQDPDDAQPVTAQCSTWLRQRWSAHVGRRCRVPREPPSPARLAMAAWMLEHGSDVHQGGDGPLMRAALGDRIPMMELLVSHGADVNALWHGHFPIIFAPCESLDPAALKWLLDHGANPNCRDHGYEISGHSYPGTALDYVIASYARSPERLGTCIDILLEAGGTTRYDAPAVLHLLRGRLESLAEQIDADPALVNRRFSELDCGKTGGRSLTVQGGTLLHVAAEYCHAAAAALLLDRGADVNARATVDEAGVGGHTRTLPCGDAVRR